jgi:putative NADH-flavin reductase
LELTHGQELTALVRNPEKLKSWESRVRIVKGDALHKAAVEQAVRGQEAAIYAIGIKTIGRTTLFSESTRRPAAASDAQQSPQTPTPLVAGGWY